MFLNSYSRPVLILSIMLVCQGCVDSNMTDLRNFVADAYQDKKPEIEPLPEIPPYKGFVYGAVDENGPFRFDNIVSNRGDDAIAESKRPERDRIKEPLEEFPLDALSMVGTMSQKGVPWVVVKTSRGTALLAKVGMYLGQNDGKITNIFPDEERVVLVETVLDSAGRWITRDVEIKIDE